ncbi:MAG TPA: tripartite tricarboxylate transporter TctB family protein [Noviherbaspirillum sp.]|nr:tripartite tricarboxylate transporter TctB family protein [Noviherbaspirillum sp.]
MNLRQFIKRWGASVLVTGIGIATVVGGLGHHVGTAARMGPGYFPVALGILLIGLGIIVGLITDRDALKDEQVEEHVVDLRGWGCIIAGIILFMILGEYAGFIPATFVLVFVAALGDRENTLKSAAILAAGVTVFGVLVFTQLLELNIPLFKFGS